MYSFKEVLLYMSLRVYIKMDTHTHAHICTCTCRYHFLFENYIVSSSHLFILIFRINFKMCFSLFFFSGFFSEFKGLIFFIVSINAVEICNVWGIFWIYVFCSEVYWFVSDKKIVIETSAHAWLLKEWNRKL